MTPDPELKELRALARMAWNNWPDSPASRQAIAEQEARDPISACAWDRVILALASGAAHEGRPTGGRAQVVAEGVQSPEA